MLIGSVRDWFDREYARRLGARAETMRAALILLQYRGGTQIVETGCAHNAGDWEGAGLSTVVFGHYASVFPGHLWTVDNDAAHLGACIQLTLPYAHAIEYVNCDSAQFLHSMQWIDLLYLDSHDYPYGELLDLYGGKTDLPGAIRTLRELPENVIVETHGDVISASQEHCLRELRAALPRLHPYSVVLIDDAGLPGGGKARLARRVLAGAGWTCLLDRYQTLWVRQP